MDPQPDVDLILFVEDLANERQHPHLVFGHRRDAHKQLHRGGAGRWHIRLIRDFV